MIRHYRIRKRITKDGDTRWAVEGACIRCDNACDHWVLMPWRWPTQADAEQWVGCVQQRQHELLAVNRRRLEGVGGYRLMTLERSGTTTRQAREPGRTHRKGRRNGSA